MTNVFFVDVDGDHRLGHKRNQRQRNRRQQRSHLLRLRQRSHLLRLMRHKRNQRQRKRLQQRSHLLQLMSHLLWLMSHLLRPKNLDGSKDVKPARARLLAQ